MASSRYIKFPEKAPKKNIAGLKDDWDKYIKNSICYNLL
jgi:hypothetical protein